MHDYRHEKVGEKELIKGWGTQAEAGRDLN